MLQLQWVKMPGASPFYRATGAGFVFDYYPKARRGYVTDERVTNDGDDFGTFRANAAGDREEVSVALVAAVVKRLRAEQDRAARALEVLA